MMERCMTTCDRHPERFIHVPYAELVADPLAQIERIYAFVDLELTREARDGMREWAVENARDKRPVHRYTLEKFGFSEEGLRREFARYRERFLS